MLYAQPVARIARLRASDVRLTDDGDTLLRLARDELLVPEPLGSLIRRLPHRRQRGASATLPEDPWLFPGRQVGQPQHPEHLRRRLQALAIQCRAQRNAALMELAAEILADTLGITPRTAVRWAAEAGGNWTTYAARRARASPPRATAQGDLLRDALLAPVRKPRPNAFTCPVPLRPSRS